MPGLVPGIVVCRTQSSRKNELRSPRAKTSVSHFAKKNWIPAYAGMSGGCESRHRSHAVIALEIIGDDLGVGLVEGRPEGIDHLGDLRIPAGRVQERRVHRHVVETVAAAAIAL